MNNKLFLFALLTYLTHSNFAHDEPWTASRPDGHAPISVMGDHMHASGEWMVSYRLMSMEMDALLDGSSKVTAVAAAGKYGYNSMMLPKEMSMTMHMVGFMYAVSEKWTLMGMINYLDNDMTMQRPMMEKMESDGIGDFKAIGLYDLARLDHGGRVHLNFGISMPTGSIDEKNSFDQVLGYCMQLGSGTWDFNPAITYLGQTENYSFGAQVGGVIRIGENNQNYTLGNKIETVLWGARNFSDSLSASVKFDYSSQNEISGSDPRIDSRRTGMMDSSSFDAKSKGRDLTTFGLGINYYFQEGQFKGHRLAVEWETPIDQKVNGVQLELDPSWTVGWQYSW